MRVALALAWLGSFAWAKGGSLDALAARVVEKAQPFVAKDDDVAIALSGNWPRLEGELAALILARLSARTVARAEGDRTWARRQGIEKLLELQVEASEGKLRVTGHVVAISHSLWTPQPESVVSFVFSDIPLDAELRSLQSTSEESGPRRFSLDKVGELAPRVLALDVGDVDGDGSAELVGVTAEESLTWRFAAGKLALASHASLVGKMATRRPRSDVGTVRVSAGAVLARSSRQAGSFPLAGFSASCELEPGQDWFLGKSCAQNGLPEKFWAAAAYGPLTAAVAKSGVLILRTPQGERSLGPVGAQLAWIRAGAGLLVTTLASWPGQKDALVLRESGGAVLQSFDVAGGVQALATGDLDGDGAVDVVAAVRGKKGSELWLLH
jgi:hypothetical protein